MHNLRFTSYGPFWITSTVVFLMAAAGNINSYVNYASDSKDNNPWHYDINYVSFSAFAIYGYSASLRSFSHVVTCQIRFHRSYSPVGSLQVLRYQSPSHGLHLHLRLRALCLHTRHCT